MKTVIGYLEKGDLIFGGIVLFIVAVCFMFLSGCSSVLVKGGDSAVYQTQIWAQDGKIELKHSDGTSSYKDFKPQYPLQIPGNPPVSSSNLGLVREFLVGVDVAHLHAAPWIAFKGLGVGDFGLDIGSTIGQDEKDALTLGLDWEKRILLFDVIFSVHLEQPWLGILAPDPLGSTIGMSVAFSIR